MSDAAFKGMPSSVRIGCYTFAVVVGTKHEHSRTYGWNEINEHLISLSPGLKADQAANTFLHEVVHGIHWVYGLMRNPEEIQPSEEDYTRQTTNGLCAFWQDNPEAMKWWLKALNTKKS